MGLRVLVPSIGPWLERFRLQTEGCRDRGYMWIRQRLQEHTLSVHLNVLVGDSDHLKSCYQDEAFLRQDQFCKSLLTCLRAVENNRLSTLAELDPSLLVEQTQPDRPVQQVRRHRRSPSLPTNIADLAAALSPIDECAQPTSVRCNGFCVPQSNLHSRGCAGHLRTSTADPISSRDRRNVVRSHGSWHRPHLVGLGGMAEELSAQIPRSTTWDSGLVATLMDSGNERASSSIPSAPQLDGVVDDKNDPFCNRRLTYGRRCSVCPSARRSKSEPCLTSLRRIRRRHAWERNRRTSRSHHDIACCAELSDAASETETMCTHEFEISGRSQRTSDASAPSEWKDGGAAGSLDDSELTLPPSGLPVVNYCSERSLESSMSGTEETLALRSASAVAPLSSTPISSVLPSESSAPVHRSPAHVRSKSDVVVRSTTVAAGDPKNVDAISLAAIPMSSSLPSDLDIQTDNRQSYDVGHSTRLFRPPVMGQSLTSFLAQQDFRTCADLERENAHFHISEALIAAIEQMKCNHMLKIAEEADQESDDEEIKHLKQRIRIRRRERLQEKITYRSPHLLSDGRTDTTSQSPSPRSTSSDNKSGNTSDSVDQIDLSDGSEAESKLSTLNESGLSLSMASLYSDADIHRPIAVAPAPSSTESQQRSSSIAESLTSGVSAESVALSLLKKFSEKQLPKASDLDWLVSEADAPQKLLPLPQSWPISPDDAENVQQTRLRGNLEWAPPRPQVIFSVHPTPQKKIILAKQNYRCAGCGTKVEQGYMRRFQYCEYLGKYFCQCCHNKGKAYIPAKILRKWDFSKSCVSNFSRDVLEKMYCEPLYDVADVNPGLYRRVKALNQVQQYRQQLFSIKDFIRVCRDGKSLAEELERQPSHLIASPHVYSVNDLVRVKSGEMSSSLKTLVNQALLHIKQCPLCQAKGFYCEFCKNNKEIIFPFQLGKVSQCPECWSCFHSDCYVPEKCPKCARIEARKLRLLQNDDTD